MSIRIRTTILVIVNNVKSAEQRERERKRGKLLQFRSHKQWWEDAQYGSIDLGFAWVLLWFLPICRVLGYLFSLPKSANLAHFSSLRTFIIFRNARNRKYTDLYIYIYIYWHQLTDFSHIFATLVHRDLTLASLPCHSICIVNMPKKDLILPSWLSVCFLWHLPSLLSLYVYHQPAGLFKNHNSVPKRVCFIDSILAPVGNGFASDSRLKLCI